MGRRLTNLVYPLLDRKQWRFIRVSHHYDNYPLKQPTPALNYVEVSQSDGIEATRINGNHDEEVLKRVYQSNVEPFQPYIEPLASTNSI